MEYLKVSEESIKKAAQVIREGGIAAFPTETVYGLGADAFNAAALARIFEAKSRPRFDPLIIHIASMNALNEVADLSRLSEDAKRRLFILTEKFWPGPLSIVLPKNERIPGIATAGLPSAAVRFPANRTAQKLIKLSGGAVAAPSANPFGFLSPTRAEHVRDGLGYKIDIILDGGACAVGVESSVIDLTGGNPLLLRHGGITKEELEDALGEKLTVSGAQLAESEKMGTENSGQGLISPGQLKSHYAPKTTLEIFSREPDELQGFCCEPYEPENTAWLFFDSASRDKWFKTNPNLLPAACYLLTAAGNVNEAAACLFETLHEIDKLGVKRIFAQLAPNVGLGEAINDRLRRASYKAN